MARVSVGRSFDFVAEPVDWPAWPDENNEPLLTPVEVRLLAGASAIWKTTRETAPPQAVNQPLRRAIVAKLAGGGFAWHDHGAADDPLAAFSDLPPGSVAGSRAIFSEADYGRLDHASVAVVQYVPAAWAESVCARLAHHPAIVAWAATAEELTALGPRSANELAYGRPWIACE